MLGGIFTQPPEDFLEHTGDSFRSSMDAGPLWVFTDPFQDKFYAFFDGFSIDFILLFHVLAVIPSNTRVFIF
jgi:hypothetical protein